VLADNDMAVVNVDLDQLAWIPGDIAVDGENRSYRPLLSLAATAAFDPPREILGPIASILAISHTLS
jgi:hypothetical protein